MTFLNIQARLLDPTTYQTVILPTSYKKMRLILSPMTQAAPPLVSTINTGLHIGYETTGLSFNYFNITHEKSKIHCTVQ